MSSKVLFSCDYPIYSVGRLGDGGTEFFVAGGGGKAKTGIPNSLDIHRLCVDDGGGCGSEAVLHHDTDTGVVMNSASHPIKGNQLAVGVGGECLSLEIRRKMDSHKKESKVKRRKKSKSDEEESGVSKVVSREVVVITRTQTDFSSECYQKTVAFSCHGDRVVTGGSDGIVRVWKYPSLDKVCELKGHENEIETLSCHPSKEQVVVHNIVIHSMYICVQISCRHLSVYTVETR
jgi:prolactin regulatory element-binding protein